MRAILLAAVLGLAVGLFSLGSLSGMGAGDQLPCTVIVQPGESIQAAIDKAKEGAVICLAEGTWEENLVIGKGLTLRGLGPGKSVIKGSRGPVILITSDTEIEVIVEGLTIAEAKTGDYYYKEPLRHPIGLSLGGKVKATIKGNAISGNEDDGIYMEGSAQATIQGNTISGNRGNGITMEAAAQATISGNTISENHSYGIGMGDAAQATISGNTISGNEDDGISMWDSAQATISGNTISGNRYDGIYMHDAQATIEKNTISENYYYGIGMGSYAQATIQGNAISGNRDDGIYMGGSAQATIQGNTISGNEGSGISMYDSARANISGNTISGNGVGIGMGDAAQATIEGNKITENKFYGVALAQRPCIYKDYIFGGAVRGRANEIWGNTGVCPAELKFLMTEAGGCYGPKCY
jgi:parallel beta-helix repeat protein